MFAICKFTKQVEHCLKWAASGGCSFCDHHELTPHDRGAINDQKPIKILEQWLFQRSLKIVIVDLGCKTNIDVINQFVTLRGKYVIDAGCGDMTFTRPLVENGARVLAIEPDPVQARLNRVLGPVPNLEFVEAGAEKLPAADKSVDGVFFAYSLHHVPAEFYPEVLAEIRRVLKPDGFLYVIEPMDCPWNEVMKLFHDEDGVRAAAQKALLDLAVPVFQTCQQFVYHNWSQYESWEAFVAHFASRSFNTMYTENDVRQPPVRKAFEELGGAEHRFQSPKQVMLLKNPKG